MTCRARWTRPVAALFALWFAFVLGDPGLLHACPMHGGHGAAHASAAASHDMAAMHGEHGAPGSTTSHEGSSHHGNTQCTCVGMCCAAPAVATLPTVVAMHVPVTVARTEPVLRVALQPASAAPDTRLPFANGPPTA
jgi:hypothetical protein